MKPPKMTDALYAVVTAAFDADDVADVCAALLAKRADLRDVSDIPRTHGVVDKAALLGVGLTLRAASRLAAKLDPQGAAPAQSAPVAPTAITVRLHDDDPRKMPPKAFLTHLAEHHAEDPSLVAWADAEHPLCSTRGVVATATGIDVEATAGAEGLWSQRRDLRGETWLDQRVTTAADALTPVAEEEHDPVTGAALQRGLNPATRVSWAKVSRHDRGFAAWLAQGQSASVVRRDDGTRVAEVAGAGTLANDGTFGPLLRLYADAAKRDPDLARRSEAAAYRRPAPPSGGAPPPPFAAGAEALSGTVDLREWRGVFAAIFPTAARARMLLNDSGIATSRIRFDDTPELVWQSALEEAQKTGRLADLLRVAREEYPSSAALRALASPSVDRDAVYSALVRLLPAQFEAAVFRLSVPSHVLPGATASMAERAVALVRVAEQRGQLAQLSAIVRAT